MKLADEAGIKATVGHVERFNPAFLALSGMKLHPMFIETHRLAQFNPRGTDVSVVLDLMIHDLDIILDLVGKKLARTEAVGVKVLSAKSDIANARLNFRGGCIANVTASRVSNEKVRKIRIFFASSYISLDYASQFGFVYQKKKGHIKKEQLILTPYEPLKKEIEYFLAQTKKKKPDYTIAEQSIEALKLAWSMAETRQKAPA